MHISGIEQEKSELSLVSELSFFHFQMFIQNKGNQFHCCWWSLTAHLHEREKWSGGRQLHFPYFPKPGFPCAQIFYFYFWRSIIAWWQEKKNTVFHQFPRLWELTKFLADFRKSFLDAKINVWLHYALGGEPAEFSHRGWEGLVLF